jgi:Anti-sigma factor NepR
MEKWSNSGAAVPDMFLGIPDVERELMQKRKGKRSAKAFVNEVDPLFDPVTAALRQMHDDVALEPIPDEFLILLDKIDARFSATKKLS